VPIAGDPTTAVVNAVPLAGDVVPIVLHVPGVVMVSDLL